MLQKYLTRVACYLPSSSFKFVNKQKSIASAQLSLIWVQVKAALWCAITIAREQCLGAFHSCALRCKSSENEEKVKAGILAKTSNGWLAWKCCHAYIYVRLCYKAYDSARVRTSPKTRIREPTPDSFNQLGTIRIQSQCSLFSLKRSFKESINGNYE